MAEWYYYSGRVTTPIPTGNGVSRAVPPNHKVEIINPNDQQVQILIRQKVLRRTGRPLEMTKGCIPLAEAPKDEKVVVKVPIFGQSVAYKGNVTSEQMKQGVAPKPPGETKSETVESEKVLEDALAKERNAEKVDSLKKKDEPVEGAVVSNKKIKKPTKKKK